MPKNSKIKTALIIFLSLSILLNLFILVNAFIPGDESANASFWVADVLAKLINFFKANAINASNMESFSYVIRKLVGHFLLFLIDGVFVGFSFYLFSDGYEKSNFWIITLYIFLFGLLVASATEAIQLVIPGRVGSIIDVLIDMAGYLLTTIIVFFIFFFIHRKNKNSK